jgi:tellurite resistance protein
MTEHLDLTAAEAAVALAALVSFADDEPTEAEGVILRRYYRYATAESLQKKLAAAGMAYPSDLTELRDPIITTLGTTPREFQLRSLAVGWLLALADGHADQSEVALLSQIAAALRIPLSEARVLADSGIPEIDETVADEAEAPVSRPVKTDASSAASPATLPPAKIPSLNLTQAGIALAAWVGFADDDPTDAEVGLIREHYGADVVTRFINALEKLGIAYPGYLPALRPAITTALEKASRNEQLHMLAIAHAVAAADGEEEPEEMEIIHGFCEEFAIGMAELREYFKTSVV